MIGWWRDPGLGVRLAVSGGREGWLRLLLTASGIGLGTALLVGTTAIPAAMNSRQQREDARDDLRFEDFAAGSDRTLLVRQWRTEFRGKWIYGSVLEPEGPRAPVPPGLAKLPGPGEMVLSPALHRLLDSAQGELLRPRLPYRIVGTIGDAGLAGPNEYWVYIGGSGMANDAGNRRIASFGRQPLPGQPFTPMQILLILIIFVVLLLPIGVFIATAVRFGGEQRDRRLAALRLVGADARMTQRIAAGEALAATGLGLLFGLALFYAGRHLVDDVSALGIDVYGSDLRPAPALLASLLVAVPATAVGVALLAMRRVAVEPLGVFRRAGVARRRLWWRLIAPAVGVALVYPLAGRAAGATGGVDELRVAAGAVLLLIGVTALLPWLVEAVVRLPHGGPVAGQLAIRRLQANSATSARLVNGVAVAVAGAIALQMLFTAAQRENTIRTGQDTRRAQAYVSGTDTDPGIASRLAAIPGVRAAAGITSGTGHTAGQPEKLVSIVVGDCASLAEVAVLDRCADGDVFRTAGPGNDPAIVPPPATALEFVVWGSKKVDGTKVISWTIPLHTQDVPGRLDPLNNSMQGLLVTPSVAAAAGLPTVLATVYLQLDPAVPDAIEHVRTTVIMSWPRMEVALLREQSETARFGTIRRGLFAGALVVLGLIGVSMIVVMLEQLRERRRLLAMLAAFGTQRATLAWSVFWQATIPVLLGMVLAVLTGISLGALLLRMTNTPIHLDWASIGGMTAAGAALILLVTVLAIPALWRLMRPDGLHTE